VSDPDFSQQIADIVRRLERLQAAQRGDLGFRRVPVKRHFVTGFWVRRHKRVVIVSLNNPKGRRRKAT